MNDTTGNAVSTTVERGTLKARDIAVGPTGVHVHDLGAMLAYSKAMSEAGAGIPPFMRNEPGLCLRVLRTAMRFGLDEFGLACESFAISGQLAFQSKAIAAMILAAVPMQHLPKYSFKGTSTVESYTTDDGKKKRRRKGNLTCTVLVTLASGETIEHTSPEIGQIEIQNSPLWITDERQQIGYYTMRALCRLNLPHVMLGVYSREERAAEMAIDITPETKVDRPSIASNLTGQPKDNGFSEEHVKTEMATITEPAEIVVEDEDRDLSVDREPAVDPATETLLDDLRAALTEAGSIPEINLIESEFAQAIAKADQSTGAAMLAMINGRRAKMPKRKGKTAPGELPLSG